MKKLTRTQLNRLLIDSTNFENYVKRYIIDNYTSEERYQFMQEVVEHGGGQLGMIPGLIYYYDIDKVFEKYKDDLNKLIAEKLEETGFKSLDQLFATDIMTTDPLILEGHTRSLIVWCAFESVCDDILNRLTNND